MPIKNENPPTAGAEHKAAQANQAQPAPTEALSPDELSWEAWMASQGARTAPPR